MRFEECVFRTIQYLVRYPDNFEQGKQFPVLICIHGAGGRGGSYEDFKGHSEFTISGKMEGFPFITVAPMCPKVDGTWFDYFETLKDFIRHIAKEPFTDPARIYAMGGSMGGYTTWELAMSMPEYFAAIVPICGGGMYWNAGRLKNVPLDQHVKFETVVNVRRKNARIVELWGVLTVVAHVQPRKLGDRERIMIPHDRSDQPKSFMLPLYSLTSCPAFRLVWESNHS